MAYLKSTQVKVYPSAYRGVNDKGELFNPEAQLNTEFNITNLQANDSYRSYVISWKDSILKCVIHGYYFELTLDATTINSFTSNIYASINIQAATNVDATNTKYAAYTLVPYTQVATGIPSKNVTFVAYEEMQFIDAAEEEVSYKDIIQIVLIIIILGLLGFVVFMSLRTKKEVEEEEEISVEDLLQSTQQEELENIELEQKSEARKLIENFVEENPEAVATLLRNWLDEDWG